MNGRHLVLANVGDCKCYVINSQGAARKLTVDHKYDNQSERQRV